MRNWLKKAVASAAVGCALVVGGCTPKLEVEIGIVLPESGEGGFAEYGQSVRRGIDVAWDQIQREAQDSGEPVPFSIEIVDSGGDPERAAELLRGLYEGGAHAAIGGVISAEALTMVAVANEQEKVLLSPTASSPELSGISRYFFRVFPSDSVEGTTMATHAVEKRKMEQLVVVSSEDPYGRGVASVFADEVQRRGAELVEQIEFPPGSDLTGIAERVDTLGPEGVFIVGFWDECVTLIKELRKRGMDGTRILTTSAIATPKGLAQLGRDAEGVQYAQIPFEINSDEEPMRGFRSAYQLRFDQAVPDIYAGHGYDALMVLRAAVQGQAQMRGSLDLWKNLVGLSEFRGVTGIIRFNDRGDVRKSLRVYVFDEEGVPVSFEEQQQVVRQRLQELQRRMRQLRNRGAALSDSAPPGDD